MTAPSAPDLREELHALTQAAAAQLEILRDSGCDALGLQLPKASPAASEKAAAVKPVAPRTAAAHAQAPQPAPSARSATISSDIQSPPTPKAAASTSGPRGTGAPEVAQRLTVIEQEVRACTRCALHQLRTQTVFARGTGSSGLCFVGEGPGADEDIQGLPFVGKAGQLLDKMIVAMGLQPSDVYVCNIVKCRPPNNRKPEPEEMAACVPYLQEQIDLIAPEVIVALGATAVQGLFGASEGITRLRGRWKLYRGKIPVMPTFHPAYLLRQPEAKRDVWNDLQAVLRHMGRAVPNPTAPSAKG
ncbi:MAG TPA: uracil-DNA glycosylase [Polyangiaceae bacterium]|nr:uracil-DNA glycosylase [Polyangiaceae bacterium]